MKKGTVIHWNDIKLKQFGRHHLKKLIRGKYLREYLTQLPYIYKAYLIALHLKYGPGKLLFQEPFFTLYSIPVSLYLYMKQDPDPKRMGVGVGGPIVQNVGSTQ